MYYYFKDLFIRRFSLLEALMVPIFFISSLNQIYAQPTTSCGLLNTQSASGCEYISNGDFSDILEPVSNQHEVPNANWWNYVIGDCLVPNWGAAPDLFSELDGDFGWETPFNNYSNNLPINDPTGDGNYAAINVFEPGPYYSPKATYLEQELFNTLYPGFEYEVSLQVRFAPVSSRSATIGIYLTENIINSYNFIQNGDPSGSTVLEYIPNTSGNWELIQIPFEVTNQSEFITIGYRQGTVPIEVNTNLYNGNHVGYYYVDDVDLKLLDAPDTSFNMTVCNSSGLLNIESYRPHIGAFWTLISGNSNGQLSGMDYLGTDLDFNNSGNYIVEYTFICDGVEYNETFNIEILEDAQLLSDTIFVCEQQVDLSEYTDGLTGEWTINSGNGVINNNIYSDYDTGISTMTFIPDLGQEPCQFLSYEITVVYTPYPKTTSNTYESDVWNDVVIDSDGNIYAVGTYVSNTRIDGNYIENGIADIAVRPQFMVAKYDPCGVLIWYAWGIAACPSYNKGTTTGTSIAYDKTYQRVYISGQHKGMILRNSNGNTYNAIPGSGSICYGNETVPYVLELNSITGNYEDFNGHLGDITTINSLAIADDGVFNHHLYLGGVNENPNNSNGVICKLKTHTNYTNSANLEQSFPNLSSSNAFNSTINDLFYKDQILYSIGTTNGSLSFGQKQVNLNLYSGSTSAWVAATYHDNSGFNVLAIGDGGSCSNQSMNRTMTGEQIYVDHHDFIVVSGLFNYMVENTFYGGVSHVSQSSNMMDRDLYIFKLVQLGSNIQMYQSGSVPPFDFVSSFGPPNSEISSLAMTGYKDNIYISGAYSGNDLLFGVSNAIYSPSGASSKKIFTAHYELYPDFNKTWFNTTVGFIPNEDVHTIKGMCALNNKVYNVGNYTGTMNFQNNNFGPVDEITSTLNGQLYSNSGFIYRNDHQESGMFKSLDDDKESIIFENERFNIYPNPNNGAFVLEGVKNLTFIEIVDAVGKKVSFSSSSSNDKVFIKIHNFVGLAIVKVNSENYRVLVQ